MSEILNFFAYKIPKFYLANARSPRCYHNNPNCPHLSGPNDPVELDIIGIQTLFPKLEPCSLCGRSIADLVQGNKTIP